MITCDTGGIGEAVGEHAIMVPTADPQAIGAALDQALALSESERAELEHRARDHALQFDRALIFDRLLGQANEFRLREARIPV